MAQVPDARPRIGHEVAPPGGVDVLLPESMDDLVRNLTTRFPDDALVVSVRMPGSGVTLRGRVVQNLPSVLGVVLAGGVLLMLVGLVRVRRRGYVLAVVDVVYTANLGYGRKLGIGFPVSASTTVPLIREAPPRVRVITVS